MATFTVRGHKVRTQSRRRYVVVSVYGERPSIVKRTDNLATARQHRTRDSLNRSIMDTATGEWVA